jgi:outer membrane protein
MTPARRWSIFVLVLFGICRVSPGLAGETRALSCDLPACIDMALANHPLLKVGEARRSAARSQLDVRLAERQPSLDLEGETGYLEGKAVTPFSALAGVTEEGTEQRRVSGGYYQAIVGLEVPLVKEGTLYGYPSGSVRQAQLKIAEEDWQQRVLRLQVAWKVTEVYVQVLKHRKAVQSHETIVASLEEGYRLAQSRFQQQLISRNELLSAEVRSATAKRDLALSRLNLQKSQRLLVSAMGLEQAEAVNIQDLQEAPTPLPPLDTLVARARQVHPELKARQFRVQGGVEEVKRIQSERYPTLSLTSRYAFVDNFEGRLNDQWVAALKVKVPIFDFGLLRKKADVARARVAEEETHLQDVQLGLEQELQALYLQLRALDEQAVLLKIQVEQAAEEMKLNRALFRQELLPHSAALDAEAALLRYQLALADVEYDQKLARLQLSLVSGEWEPKAP